MVPDDVKAMANHMRDVAEKYKQDPSSNTYAVGSRILDVLEEILRRVERMERGTK